MLELLHMVCSILENDKLMIKGMSKATQMSSSMSGSKTFAYINTSPHIHAYIHTCKKTF